MLAARTAGDGVNLPFLGTVGFWSFDYSTGVLSIIAQNTPPTIAGNSGSVNANEPNAANSGTWSDANVSDNVILTASRGTVIKLGPNSGGTWSWTESGLDGLTPAGSFTVTIFANDGTATSQTQFTVTVNNINPTASDDGTPSPAAGYTTSENASFTTADVRVNDSDPAGGLDLLTTAVLTQPALGSVSIGVAPGTFLFNPGTAFDFLPAGGQATTTFTYTLSDGDGDGDGGTDVGQVTITVTGVNDIAVITVNGPQDTAVVEAGGIANGIPGDPSAGGELDVSDVDFLHMLTQDNAIDTLVGGAADDWVVLNTLGSTAIRDKGTLDGQDFSQQDD